MSANNAPSTLCTVPVAPNGLEGWSSCCGAAVTFSDAFGDGPVLCCKACYEEVLTMPLRGDAGVLLGEVAEAVIDGFLTPGEGVEWQREILVEVAS